MPRSTGERFTFLPMDAERAEEIAAWRYPPPYDIYDGEPSEASLMTRIESRYAAVLEDGQLVGFCCLGSEARVPGLRERVGVLDVGAGLRPDLVGRGRGARFLSAVMEYAWTEDPKAVLRVCIAEFNLRAQRAVQFIGFAPAGEHRTSRRTFRLFELRRNDSRWSSESERGRLLHSPPQR
jgi:RimJ/RimL family protein N-acetyltransferase